MILAIKFITRVYKRIVRNLLESPAYLFWIDNNISIDDQYLIALKIILKKADDRLLRHLILQLIF